MQVKLSEIPLREALHFLGWRGTPLEPELLAQIEEMIGQVTAEIQPHVLICRFKIGKDGALEGTAFVPQGEDVRGMLASCHEAMLLAATLGAGSERMLLRQQAKSSAQAVLLDAVLSAAIEAVCDEQEAVLRKEFSAQGLYLTDRFSPGYGDMPLAQTKEICCVLSADKAIGLTVSQSGIMIPRKSVTAIMGISHTPVVRRPSGCAACSMRQTCALCRKA